MSVAIRSKSHRRRIRGPKWQQIANFEYNALTPNPTGFDSVTNIGGGLSVSAVSPLRGAYSLAVDLSAVAANDNAYLTDPSDEKHVIVEFLMDENTLAMGGGEAFNLLRFTSSGVGGISLQSVRLEVGGTTRITAIGDVANSNVDIILGSGTHQILIDFKISDKAGQDNGHLMVFKNGVLVGSAFGLDNDTHDVDAVGFNVAGVDVGTSGVLKFDDFKWAKG